MVFRFFIPILIILLVVGCGYNPDEPVYDVVGNPENFPPVALSLLVDLENGKLIGMEAITESFGNLYAGHAELLDRPSWKIVIGRLGSKFRYIADTLAGQGMSGYSLAAEYYQLSSFAAPDDRRLRHRADLMGCWLRAERRTNLDLSTLARNDTETIEPYIAATRYFLLADSVHRQFFDEYLHNRIAYTLERAGLLTDSLVASLPASDRALLALARYGPKPAGEGVAEFSSPAIGLLASRVTPLDSVWYAVECYLVAREEIVSDLTVSIRLHYPDSTRPDFSSELQFAQVDLKPTCLSESWRKNEVAVVTGVLRCFSPPSSVSVALFDAGSSPVTYLQAVGSESHFVTIESAEIGGL